MSRRGNCWDNAVAESFFSSLKKERIKKRIYKDRDEATSEIRDYIESFYNRTRRHSHLGGVSPEQFEVINRRGRRSSPHKILGTPPIYPIDTSRMDVRRASELGLYR